MLFALINWLSISINLLLVVFVIVCLLMSLLILMQRPKQEGLGAAFGGGVTDQVFGARTTNVLQKGTVYLGSLFFLLSLTLAILISKQTQQRTLLEPKTSATEVVAPPAGVSKEVPPVEPVAGQRSLADELSTDPSAPAIEAQQSTDNAVTAPAKAEATQEEATQEEAPALPLENPSDEEENEVTQPE